jgi:lysophospholipase L1-like esterase
MPVSRTCRYLTALVALSAIPALPGRAAADDEFFFRPKDRIVFLGDSITEQFDYTNLIEYYLVTRFPTWDLVFYNAGIGGDTAGGGNGRAARDVLSERPTAVTINFGMNDGGYRGPDDKIYASYIKNQEALVKKLTDAKVRVALMATSPVEGRKRKDGETYNETLAKFCDGLNRIADKYGATHVDQFHPALAVLLKMTADKAPFDCFPDSVHTNSRGGLLMAHSILTAMHAPAVVSDATLQGSGQVKATTRCKITDVKVDQLGGIAFNRVDEALPLVVSADQKALLPYLDQLAGLNYYGLKLVNLPPEQKYDLKIDGKVVAALTGEQLGKGVNLTQYDLGPIGTQSADVWKALLGKNQLLRYRFNTFRRGAGGPTPGLSEEQQKEFTALRDRQLAIVDEALDGQRTRVYGLAQPKGHLFELTRVK